MKADLDRTFNPVKIELTLYSKRELELLWALFAGDYNNLVSAINSNQKRLDSNKITPPKTEKELEFLFTFFDKLADAWEFYGVDNNTNLNGFLPDSYKDN